MKKKNHIPQKENRVLGTYRKVGRKFVPPMLQAFQFDHVSWASHTLPELIWWDVIADKISHRFAAKVAGEIGEYFKGAENRKHWWAFISDYSQLSEDRAGGLRQHLSRTNVLSPLRESLTDFLDLYPKCPISSLLDGRPSGVVDVGYLIRFENRLEKLQDKRSRSGVLIQAQALYLGFVLGKLRVKKGLALADFPEVEHYPNTEKSKIVGASICATVNMLAGTMLPRYQEDSWVQYFWKRSLDLRPLNFGQLEKV